MPLGDTTKLSNVTTTGLEGSVEIWAFLSPATTISPSVLLYSFSITMPAWSQLCVWLEPVATNGSTAYISAFLNRQLVADRVLLGAFNQTAPAVVERLWTNMETFR